MNCVICPPTHITNFRLSHWPAQIVRILRSYLIRIDSIVDLLAVSSNEDSSPTPEDDLRGRGPSVRHASAPRCLVR